ncbi:glycoprotease [Selenomonas noxia]|uniref:glycoprotease n=1 Tax=Selenomonas noxia TaxID=135083 RepID=UPI0028ED06DF|nr:glycoprotease [Selenomonas noxia]
MFERVKDIIIKNKTALLVILCLLIIGIAYAVGRNSASDQKVAEKPAILTQGQTQDAAALRAQLDISRANAQALQKRLAEAQAGQRAPTVTYHVTAPTVGRAAQVVERQIREDDPTLPRAAREKSDRTVVTPITKDKDGKDLPAEEQKVDVYKINLNKAHKIKAGVTQIDTQTYWTAGLQLGRWEGLVHGQSTKVKGGSVMYTVAEW